MVICYDAVTPLRSTSAKMRAPAELDHEGRRGR
jgi:hypothetical protein